MLDAQLTAGDGESVGRCGHCPQLVTGRDIEAFDPARGSDDENTIDGCPRRGDAFVTESGHLGGGGIEVLRPQDAVGIDGGKSMTIGDHPRSGLPRLGTGDHRDMGLRSEIQTVIGLIVRPGHCSFIFDVERNPR